MVQRIRPFSKEISEKRTTTSEVFKVINRRSAVSSGPMMNSSLHLAEMIINFMYGPFTTLMNPSANLEVILLLSKLSLGPPINMDFLLAVVAQQTDAYDSGTPH